MSSAVAPDTESGPAGSYAKLSLFRSSCLQSLLNMGYRLTPSQRSILSRAGPQHQPRPWGAAPL
jgi:hypothetical protein